MRRQVDPESRRQRHQRIRTTALLAGCALAVCGPPRRARGANSYWDINGIAFGAGGATPSGAWSSASWSSSSIGNLTTSSWISGDTAVFSAGTDATGSYTVTASGQIISGINVEEGTVTIDGTSLNSAGGGIAITTTPTANINAKLSGIGGLSKSGSGTLTLGNSANDFSGFIFVNAGKLQIDADTDLGDSANLVTLDTGTLAVTSSFSTSRTLFFADTVGSSLDVSAATTLTFAGTISGGGSGGHLDKTGSGDLLLTGHSNFNVNSTLRVNGGTLKLGVNDALPTDAQLHGSFAGTFDMAGFNQTLLNYGPGSIINSGATLSTLTNTGGFGYNGIISGNIALVSNATGTVLDLGGANTYTGSTTINSGRLQLTAANAVPSTSAVLLASGTTFDLNTWNDTIGSLSGAGGVILSATLTTGADNSSTTSSARISGSDSLTKTGIGTFTMSCSSANTYTGTTTVNQGTLALATSAAGVVAVPGNVVVGDGAGAATDTLRLLQSEQIANTSAVTIASSGVFDLGGNTETIAALTMTGGQVTGGAGTLVLNGPLTTNASAASATIAPKVNLNGPTRVFTVADGAAASDLTISASVENGSIFKNGAGTMTVGFLRLNDLNLSGGHITLAPDGGATGVSILNTMSINGPWRFDIKDNHLIARNMDVGTWNGTFYTAMTGLIASGRNGGGGGGNWNGNGIVTSLTAATTGNFTSIGIATASQVKSIAAAVTATWAGQTVMGSDALVMYTYGGDANLDGKINVDDYGRIDFNVNLGTAGWYNGDFNYDGKINVDDYGIIDFNVGIQGAPFPTAAGPASDFGELSRAVGLAAVPEPATLSLLLGANLLSLRRRRSDR